jgi:hypothetical protein
VIRFIIKTKWRDGHSGAEGECFKTLDLDVPALQDALTIGGYGECGYEMAQLIGVETLKETT